MIGYGWGGCFAHCKAHWGICMVMVPHDIHDTGLHQFTETAEEVELAKALSAFIP